MGDAAPNPRAGDGCGLWEPASEELRSTSAMRTLDLWDSLVRLAGPVAAAIQEPQAKGQRVGNPPQQAPGDNLAQPGLRLTLTTKGAGLGAEEFNEMGPIDYLLVEWPGRQPTGEAAPLLLDLVDRGLIRILDLAFLSKAEDGSITRLEVSDLGGEVEAFAGFEGASSGVLSEEDTNDAASVLEPGTSVALLVYENRWAGPFAAAVRRSGGQLVASGRIPIQAMLAALEAAEAA